MVVKAEGSVLMCRWDCINSGDAPGQAFLRVTGIGTLTSQSIPQTINPGATVQLTLDTTLEYALGAPIAGTYSPVLEMVQSPGGNTVGSFPFPLTITPGVIAPADVIVDPGNKMWLCYNRDSNGDGVNDPYFMVGAGDPEDFLYIGTRNADGTRNGTYQTDLLNRLVNFGCNCLYLQVVKTQGGDAIQTPPGGDPPANPFVGGFTTTNFTYQGLLPNLIAQWEQWFTLMDDHGIMIFLFIYDDQARPWGSKGDGVITNNEAAFITDLINAFKHHHHLTWCLAEEADEKFTNNDMAMRFALIKSIDPVHPVSIHLLSNTSMPSALANDPNLDQFAFEFNTGSLITPTFLHNGSLAAWNSSAGRYNVNSAEQGDQGRLDFSSPGVIRRELWAMAMAGSYIMLFEMFRRWIPSDADLAHMGYMRSFFESTRINRMAPHDELKAGGTEYVMAEPGTSYIAYASALSGDLGLLNVTFGQYDMLWLNIPTGFTVTQAAVQVGTGAGAGTIMFPKPASIGTELALYLHRVG
jgi:hypothetical protein